MADRDECYMILAKCIEPRKSKAAFVSALESGGEGTLLQVESSCGKRRVRIPADRCEGAYPSDTSVLPFMWR